MKKKILVASAALAASTAFGFTTWSGDDGTFQVDTGIQNEMKKQGYWFSYDDNKDGGASKVVWPTEKGNEYDKNALDPIITQCQGVCGTAVLDAGTLTYKPFVGIGINVVGETSATDPTPAAGDASAWGGVCIAYSTTATATLELGLGDAGDKDIAYDNPFKSLPKGEKKVMDIAWSEFEQAGWGVNNGGKAITGTEAAGKLVALKFKIQDEAGSYSFNIMSIGAKGGGCAATGGTLPSGDGGTTPGGTTPGGETTPGGTTPGGTTPAAIADISVSSAKAILSGRTLSFSGISSAKVEILNLQGQIVMKGSAASSMNLMGLDAGVYMVRIAGKAVNMSQKILVK
jgi:hypothetical protein